MTHPKKRKQQLDPGNDFSVRQPQYIVSMTHQRRENSSVGGTSGAVSDPFRTVFNDSFRDEKTAIGTCHLSDAGAFIRGGRCV